MLGLGWMEMAMGCRQDGFRREWQGYSIGRQIEDYGCGGSLMQTIPLFLHK
jgi:hypothetical protein